MLDVPEAESHKSDGRRFLRSDETWKGWDVIPDDHVDYLITQCDISDDDGGSNTLSSGTSRSPFAVFAATTCASQQGRDISAEVVMESETLHELDLVMDIDTTLASLQEPEMSMAILPLSPGLSDLPDLHRTEKFLLNHYVNHVAVIMMPYEHYRNPWRTHYPSVAYTMLSSGHRALYDAILAHAAFNLSVLRGDEQRMSFVGSRHYTKAIQQVLPSLTRNEEASIAMAAIMTLMMTEVYTGTSTTWRAHLQGACTLLQQQTDASHWLSSDFSCTSLQSLRIIDIIGSTSRRSATHRLQEPELDMRGLFGNIQRTRDFGFTIGASQTILECIADITEIRSKKSLNNESGWLDIQLARLLSRLNAERERCSAFSTQEDPSEHETEVASQQSAFVEAAYIYMYRVLLEVPPKQVQSYVSRIFENVTEFYAVSEGNFSIWPAFIAAVEAYTPDDLTRADRWLSQICRFGMGNRKAVKEVVEEVWRRRSEICERSGIEMGMITVDWTQVIMDFGFDVLIV
ncbi:uncharacterized protein AB675_7797 [Cyphellophora attinorum]|uniref:Uncharacterized protein n=1 Tax=Cyphellophora attinorum TaxID=1664694 RepID=A0A0N1H4T0_9EURO|nr:uncharacterized protein AB675_7797 [Phialophora attinorum]KPI40450.1 hypothetical protein AB675_7797 [Phialophora attinorum]